MQHVLQISRKIDYALRAMLHLAGLPEGRIASLQDLSSTLHLPREFLAKILKVLAARGLVRSARGAHGGYQWLAGRGRSPSSRSSRRPRDPSSSTCAWITR